MNKGYIILSKMKKTLLILTTLALIGLSNLVNAQGPNWVWAESSGNTSNDQGRSVATDINGNIFMTGYFNGSTITFGDTTLTSEGNGDIFIVKYDANGNVLWAKSAGGTDYDLSNGITTDASGNVLITGSFESETMIFETITLTNADNTGIYSDIFIAKYDASGNVLWAKRAGETESDVSNGITTDASENVFITGYFHSPAITFGTTTLNNTTPLIPYEDIFIVKYDPSGNVLWAKSAGSTTSSSPSDKGQSITTDASGHVFMTGYFEGDTITFDYITLTNTYQNFGDIFIVKFDTNGNVIWAKSAGSISNDLGYSLVADATGNVFISGYFSGQTITFGSTTLINANQSLSFTEDAFIVKYNSAGNVLWAKSAGGTSREYSHSLTTDTDGNAYMLGEFFSPAIAFGTTTLTNEGTADIFIAKYDPNGNLDWAESAGNIGMDYGLGISTDSNNNIYLTGGFNAPSITFGTTTLINAGAIDVFIAKVDSAILSIGTEQQTDYSSIVIAPNPFSSQTIISFKEEQQNTTIKVIDILGKEIKRINFNGKQFILEKGKMQQGVYIVHVIDANKKVMSKKIIIL